MSYLPICLDIQDRRCLVVGHGKLADDKELTLRQAGASVRRMDAFNPAEAQEAYLIIAIVETPEEGATIRRFAEQHRILINVVDQTANCNFIAPAILRRGDLMIAISTSGKCPALARRIRQQLEQEIGHEYASYLELLGETRGLVKQRLPRFEQRRAFYQQLLGGNLLNTFRDDGYQSAQARILEELEQFHHEAA